MHHDDFAFVVFSVAVVILALALSFTLIASVEREQKEHQRICAEKDAVPVIAVGRWVCVREVK
jgi:hypothetical protein